LTEYKDEGYGNIDSMLKSNLDRALFNFAILLADKNKYFCYRFQFIY